MPDGATSTVSARNLDKRVEGRRSQGVGVQHSVEQPGDAGISADVDQSPIVAVPHVAAFADFVIDAAQRQILFCDALRQRANNMLEHEREGLPPLLKFKYEEVADGGAFEPPSNYKLLKIIEVDDICLEDCLDPEKPPVMIIEPRAGHGPGIGGFKRDSEVGIALHEGYPVYFVVFEPDPKPGQTLADVLHTMRRFVEMLKALHGDRAATGSRVQR